MIEAKQIAGVWDLTGNSPGKPMVGGSLDGSLAPAYRVEAERDDAMHRSAALAAIQPEVALALAAIDAVAAEAAGLCPAALWPRVRGAWPRAAPPLRGRP